MTILEARKCAEEQVGRTLSEEEFSEVLAYTRHKSAVTGNGEDYVPLLLYDEIRNYCFRETINAISHKFMKIMSEFNYGEVKESV